MKKNIALGLMLSSLCAGYASESMCDFTTPVKNFGHIVFTKINNKAVLKRAAAAGALTLVFAACAHKHLAKMSTRFRNWYSKPPVRTLIGHQLDDAKDINQMRTQVRGAEDQDNNNAEGIVGHALGLLKALENTVKVGETCVKFWTFCCWAFSVSA